MQTKAIHCLRGHGLCMTGDPVTRRCLSCEALVSTQAFHKKDTLTTFLVGESVLDWPKACCFETREPCFQPNASCVANVQAAALAAHAQVRALMLTALQKTGMGKTFHRSPLPVLSLE